MIDLDKLLELEAKATPANVFGIKFWSDTNEKLTFAMRNNIKELCTELKAARGVVDAARVHHVVLYKRPIFEGIQDETYIPCECCICEGILKALKIYDEARRG